MSSFDKLFVNSLVVHHMVVVVQVKQAPERAGFVDGEAVRRAHRKPMLTQRT